MHKNLTTLRTPCPPRSRHRGVPDALETGPAAALFQELVKERTEAAQAATGTTPARARRGPSHSHAEDGAAAPRSARRRMSTGAHATAAAAAAGAMDAAGAEAPAVEDNAYDYEGGGAGDYDLAPLDAETTRTDAEEDGEPAAKRARRAEAAETEGAAVAEGAMNARSRAFLSRVKSALKKAPGRGRGAGAVGLGALVQGRGRAEAARMFYECLVLKAHGKVQLAQQEAYAEIMVSVDAN